MMSVYSCKASALHSMNYTAYNAFTLKTQHNTT